MLGRYLQRDTSTSCPFIDPKSSASTASSPAPCGTDPRAPDGPPWLDEIFGDYYNQSTFLFRHGLVGHPLLDLPNLVDLAKRLERYDAVYWSNGPVIVSDGWAAGTNLRRPLIDTLETIHDSNSLVILRSVVHDPILGPLMREVLRTIIDIAGAALREDLTMARATILIASPHRITPYHIDSDVNYLLQTAGTKQFHVYNQTDRTLTTNAELEGYFVGNASSAIFKEDRQQDATIHHLDAGFGVHVPSLAPHWAQNGNEVSIAVSFNFDLRSVADRAASHKVNARLRRIGLSPRAPEPGARGNHLKIASYRVFEAARRLVRGNPKSDEFGWRPPSRR